MIATSSVDPEPVCDDDNDSSQCSTYASRAITHGPTDEVTLIGMKNQAAVFFRGHITPDGMDGKIVSSGVKGKALVPFKAKLDQCVAQSWVKLGPESASNAF